MKRILSIVLVGILFCGLAYGVEDKAKESEELQLLKRTSKAFTEVADVPQFKDLLKRAMTGRRILLKMRNTTDVWQVLLKVQ